MRTASLHITKPLLEELYLKQGLSTRQCADVLGKPVCISWYLKKFGIEARPVGCTQGKKRKVKLGKKHHAYKGGKIDIVCKVCGDTFKVYPSQKKQRVRCKTCKKNHMTENWIGKEFGFLVVIGRRKLSGAIRPTWLCRCSCGNEKDVTTADLKSGFVKSCGCGLLNSGENNHNWKPKVKVECAWCGTKKEIQISRSNSYKNFFCGDKDCYGKWCSENRVGKNHPKWKPRVKVKCAWCGKEKRLVPSRAKSYEKSFCDLDCQGRWISKNKCGENNPNWRDGAKNDPYCVVFHQKYFRQEIFERDGYKCQNVHCTKKTDKLSIHHIDYDKGNCHPDNLITLCVSCNSKANSQRRWHTAYYNAFMQRSGKTIST